MYTGTDLDFSHAAGSDPTKKTWLHILTGNVDGTTAITVKLYSKLTFYVKCFDRLVKIAES